MPTSKAENVPQVAWTDHRSRQHPQQPESAEGVLASPELIPFPGTPVQPRDLALAYYNLTADGKPSQAARAGQILLAVQKSDPPDADVLTALGLLAPSLGITAQAADFDREALKLDPLNLLAANNLTTLLAKSGQLNAAVLLWQSAYRPKRRYRVARHQSRISRMQARPRGIKRYKS
jgi:Flp pilus assembly protein TadD